MSHSNPTVLTNAIRFRPSSFRGHNRNSSRSPIRKSLFLAKEIDPFLSNLSPDSTLRALRATSTIGASDAGQDTLAESISDASPEEREIGIRAALTAQKLKQWRQELENWPWPNARDRRSGLGFMLPRRASVPSLIVLSNTHVGYLPSDSVKAYQEKIEDIRDGVEALELDEIKDHIFSNYIPPTSPAELNDTPGKQINFGRMRDFTALITATVVQALPDMAQVNMLLDTWDIRLAILRQVPSIEQELETLQQSIDAAKTDLQAATNGVAPADGHIRETKIGLGKKVSALGSRVDKLLDLLEGQEDTLPKIWIDSLEAMENDFAAWVELADHTLAQRRLSVKTITKQPSIQIHGPDSEHMAQPLSTRLEQCSAAEQDSLQASSAKASVTSDLPLRDGFCFPFSQPSESSLHTRKPSLNIKVATPGHKRDVSEVSVAESALSGISDLSNAEIVDARSTILLSPKISVVDNPFRSSHDGIPWLKHDASSSSKEVVPPVLHRASTTSIRMVSKDSVRPVTVIRSSSFDLLSSARMTPPSTPSTALRQLTGQESPRSSADFERLIAANKNASPPGRRRSSMSRHPSLMVQPLTTKSKNSHHDEEMPPLPRRSSKRTARSDTSDDVSESGSRSSPSELTEPQTPEMLDDIDPMIASPLSVARQSPQRTTPATLEEKIKDILTTIPTQIKLDDGSGTKRFLQAHSGASTRSSTPIPALTLCPAKVDRASRKSTPGDVRLFHLTRAGQAKDAAPVKLFVRSVGEQGERVMVRVGGGWADLAEYLREYSVHHGSRGLVPGQLEVASLPAHAAQIGFTSPINPSAVLPEPEQDAIRPDTPSKRRFSLGSLSNLEVGRTRKGSRSKSLPSEETADMEARAPPVPDIPSPYTANYSTPLSRKENSVTHGQGLPYVITANTGSHGLYNDKAKTPVIVTTPISTGTASSYTPLGAAGPKSSVNRRAASHNMLRQDNEAWVEGMVDKARAVSGGSTPSYTVSITGGSASKPGYSSRRTPQNDHRQQIPYPISPCPADPKSAAGSLSRSKSRLGFGDVGSIKRVFLRRKSEKA